MIDSPLARLLSGWGYSMLMIVFVNDYLNRRLIVALGGLNSFDQVWVGMATLSSFHERTYTSL